MTTALRLFMSHPDRACKDLEPSQARLFFADESAPEDVKAAKAICYSCPVRGACETWALEHRGEAGIWGGLSERDRTRIHRTKRHNERVAS